MRLHPAARAHLVPDGEGRFKVEGELGFGTATDLLEASEGAFGNTPEITLDLADVTRVNSAGIALLIEWLRRARHAGRALHLVNLPEEALALARICEVEPLLVPVLATTG